MYESDEAMESQSALDTGVTGQVVEEYPGYDLPEERRISDESIRAHIVVVLEDLLAHIPSLEVYLASKQESTLLGQLQDTIEHLEMTRDRIELPPYAVSLFFSARRLSDEIHRSIVESDRQIVLAAGQIQDMLADTLSDQTNFGALIARLSGIAAALDAALENRFSIITEFLG